MQLNMLLVGTVEQPESKSDKLFRLQPAQFAKLLLLLYDSWELSPWIGCNKLLRRGTAELRYRHISAFLHENSHRRYSIKSIIRHNNS